MKYAHILMAVASECWAMEPSKLLALVEFILLQASGVKFSSEEIEAKISNRQSQDVARREGAVAVIPVRGIISNRMSMMSDISGGTSNEALAGLFRSALADDAVKAIVLDVDSPGGAVPGTEEVSSMIASSRGAKPIIAQVNATAASAAYWIATAADEIVVTPSGSVGSIGVLSIHDDVSASLDKLGVKKTLITAGKHKAEFNPFAPLTDDARAYVQARVDASHDMFIKRVASNRGVSQAAVRDGFGQGRMVDAGPAVAAGMADRIATMDETLARFGVSTTRTSSKRRALAPERERRALDLV